MTWYELWLFLHVAGTILWVGGAVAGQVFGLLAKQSGDPARTAAFGRDMATLGTRVLMPSSLVVAATGILLIAEGNWSWGEPFIVLGLIGWAIVAFTAFGYLARGMRDAGTQIAMDGPSPELMARVGRLVLLARVLILVLAVLVFLMVVKPGT